MSSQGSEVKPHPPHMLGADLPPETVERPDRLRRRFEESRDRFTEREVAHLLFVRWPVETGRVPT